MARTMARTISWRVFVGLLCFSTGAFSAAAETAVGGPVEEEVCWTANESPYVVTQNIEVLRNAVLTIEPGVTIRFGKYALIISGKLVARGTKDRPIVFTSNRAEPQAGDWLGLQFKPTSPSGIRDADGQYRGGSILEHCVVEYGAGIVIDRCAPLVSSCIVRYNTKKRGGGILISQANPVIQACEISHNSAEESGGGIRSLGGSPSIRDNVIAFNLSLRGSGGGISADYSAPVIAGNTIAHNAAYDGGGIATGVPSLGEAHMPDADFSEPTITGNTLTHNYARNSGGGIHVQGSPVITENLIVNNCLGYGVLKLEPDQPYSSDTRMYHLGAGICVRGTFGGPGRIEKNRIVHNLGAQWGGGIHVVRFGGSLRSNLILDNSASTAGGGVSGVMTTWSRAGVSRDHGQSMEFLDNVIAGNSGGGVEIAGGGQQTVTIRKCNITGNTRFDLENLSGNDVQTEGVWWGTSSDAEVRQRTFDYYDNQNYGRITFQKSERANEWTDLPEVETALRQFSAAAPQGFRAGLSVLQTEGRDRAVGMTWEPLQVGDVAGYRVYFAAHTINVSTALCSTGIAREGTSPIEVGNPTRFRLSGLKSGVTYSFAVTAVDRMGLESAYSDFVVLTMPRE